MYLKKQLKEMLVHTLNKLSLIIALSLSSSVIAADNEEKKPKIKDNL